MASKELADILDSSDNSDVDFALTCAQHENSGVCKDSIIITDSDEEDGSKAEDEEEGEEAGEEGEDKVGEEGDEDEPILELNERQSRRVYLLTYSCADLIKFPSRESFADAVVTSFTKSGINLTHWACCLEDHANKTSKHYHFAAAMAKVHRWNPIRRNLLDVHNIKVHFSAKTLGYVSAYRYVTKDDKNAICSLSHPELETIRSPRTKFCMAKNAEKHAKKRQDSSTASTTSTTATPTTSNRTCLDNPNSSRSKAKKRTRLTYPDVSEFILKKEIKSILKLQAVSMERKRQGEDDLFSFMAKNTEKNVHDLIERSWKMATAEETTAAKEMSRMEKLEAAGKEKCRCSGQWSQQANEVLKWNNIDREKFCSAVLTLINEGRGKDRNMYLWGPANCGKSFLLQPLEEIFNCFTTPASGKYAWTGLEEAEILFLNDFRWKSGGCIEWAELLNLLEGAPVKLSRPKNTFANDLIIARDNTIPIFATAIREIEYLLGNLSG